MSPALTREHSQDVVDSKVDCHKNNLTITTASLINSLSNPLIVPKCREEDNSIESRKYDTDAKTVGVSSLAATVDRLTERNGGTHFPTNGNANNNSSENSFVTTHRATDKMTPRIVHSTINTALSLTSVRTSVECTGMQIPQPCTSPTVLRSNSEIERMSPKASVSNICDMTKEQADLEKKISNAIKRISHLQGILLARHSKFQIKQYVENQQRLLNSNTSSNLPMSSPPIDTTAGKTVNNIISAAVAGFASSCCINGSSAEVSRGAAAFDGELSPQLVGSPSPELFSLNANQLDNTMTNAKQSDQTVAGLNSPKFPAHTDCRDRQKQQKDVFIMSANLRQMQADIDSDVTESSSGDDTDCDWDNSEKLSYKGIPNCDLKKKPCWRWLSDRAKVISRWTWLQAQVSDLEYRIRQHGELHRSLRLSKGPSLSEPGKNLASSEELHQSAARCVPLPQLTPSRHRFLRLSKASMLSRKARQPPVIKCQCLQALRRCALCAGHHNYAKPIDMETLQRRERIGQLDPGFHPILSFSREVNPALELEDVVNSSDRKLTATMPVDHKFLKFNKKQKLPSIDKQSSDMMKKKKLALKLKKSKEKKLRKAHKRKLSMCDDSVDLMANRERKKANKIAKRVHSETHVPAWVEDEEEVIEEAHAEDSLSQSAPATAESGKVSSGSYKRTSAYDIDDIVIPYHLAATTRVEKLQYKEIDTPRWREHVVNGTTIHDQLRRRSSSTSVPITPVTPSMAEIQIPVMETLSVNTDSCVVEQSTLTPVSSACSLPGSEHSSVSSFIGPEFEEDVSDSKYIALHNMMEAKEKSRYMNFVSSTTRRPRTHSVTIPGHTKPTTNLVSPGSQVGEYVEVPTTSCEPSPVAQNSMAPLSASHDSGQLKEELATVSRKRCSSFTGNRLRKEQSVDLQEEIVVPPWPCRTFPLSDQDFEVLNSSRTASQRRGSVQTSTGRRWKVISAEEEHSKNNKNSLVLKLSKT